MKIHHANLSTQLSFGLVIPFVEHSWFERYNIDLAAQSPEVGEWIPQKTCTDMQIYIFSLAVSVQHASIYTFIHLRSVSNMQPFHGTENLQTSNCRSNPHTTCVVRVWLELNITDPPEAGGVAQNCMNNGHGHE